MAKEKKVKEVKKTKTKKGTKEGLFKGIGKELKLVKWPTFKEIVKYTIATIILCAILIAFFEVITLIFAWIKELVS